jgi:hypothetical protein
MLRPSGGFLYLGKIYPLVITIKIRHLTPHSHFCRKAKGIPSGEGHQFHKQRNGPKSLSCNGISLQVQGGSFSAASTVLSI